jgi:hypothetical protein
LLVTRPPTAIDGASVRSSPRIVPAAIASCLALCLAGCGGAPAHAPAATGVLPIRAISALPARTQPLSAADVQKDSSLHSLAARLDRWGYLSGWQRTFQGESRRLTLVVSRSLTFRNRSGAAAFVAYLDAHLYSFYPYAVSHRLSLTGQSGWLIKPPMCACHMAEPLYVGVTVAGRQVRWLEINGPTATSRLLASLLSDLGVGSVR